MDRPKVRAGLCAAPAAASGPCDSDLPGRQRDRCHGHLPGSAASTSAAAAASGAGTRQLISRSLRKRERPFLAGGAFSLCRFGARRFACCPEKRAAQLLPVFGGEFFPVGAGEIEDVDRALTVGRDMRRMDDVTARVD